MDIAYLSLDVHARNCVLGLMDSDGNYLDDWKFHTAESELIQHVVRIKAKRKFLTLEEGPLAFWLARTLHEYVEDVFICDPKENRLVSRSLRKGDQYDTYSLCRLLRLGELERVYHPRDDHRAIFKSAVQTYLDLRRQQVALKQKIKAKFRGWGVFDIDSSRVFHPTHREQYLSQLEHEEIRKQLLLLYGQLDQALQGQGQAKGQMFRLGQCYPEIKQFLAMPGIGPIGAHIFDAYVQTPHRFKTRQQLWRYSCLGIVDRTSDGKPLGYQRLDRTGNSPLKAMSYYAWLGALRRREENEVRHFYERSLAQTHNRVHARLNTQRKILTSLWSIWRKNIPYNAAHFLGSVPATA